MHVTEIRLRRDKYPTLDHYPFNLELFHKTGCITLGTPVTFFVGENGTGKSTLLEALARKSGIHIWQGLERTRYEQNAYEDLLYRCLDLEWTDGYVPGSFFGADTFKHLAQNLDQWAADDPGILKYFGGKSLMTQSHGQSLMSYFKSRYQRKGLYLLDEPETALSPRNLLKLLNILNDMGRAGHAQFIIASHSPILLACPGAAIYSFDRIPLEEIAYEDTEYYQVYKRFMEDRSRYLEGGRP
jgi:predicted ATPase